MTSDMGGFPRQPPLWDQHQVLQKGTVPAPRLRRFDGAAENAGAVTVTGTDTVIATLDLGNVVAGDRILIQTWLRMTKGVTAGTNVVGVTQSAGTATLRFANISATAESAEFAFPASQVMRFDFGFMATVTVSGTLTLTFQARSLGSDSSIVAGSGGLHAWVIPGS